MRARNIPVIALVASQAAADGPQAGGAFLNTKGCVSEVNQPWYKEQSIPPSCPNNGALVVTVECVKLNPDQKKSDGGNDGRIINPQPPNPIDTTHGGNDGRIVNLPPPNPPHPTDGHSIGSIVNPYPPNPTHGHNMGSIVNSYPPNPTNGDITASNSNCGFKEGLATWHFDHAEQIWSVTWNGPEPTGSIGDGKQYGTTWSQTWISPQPTGISGHGDHNIGTTWSSTWIGPQPTGNADGRWQYSGHAVGDPAYVLAGDDTSHQAGPVTDGNQNYQFQTGHQYDYSGQYGIGNQYPQNPGNMGQNVPEDPSLSGKIKNMFGRR